MFKNKAKKSNKENFVNKFENIDFGLFDIYFPFKEHRNSWTEDKEVIVAVVNSRIAKGKESILAFNKDGEELILDPQEIPLFLRW